MDILVTYFSPTGTTKAIARELADQIKADYFEIQPEKPYTAADLNWKNPLARCNREKVFNRGIACREKIGNFSDYEIVFIGFPIWYYQEPGIIDSLHRNQESGQAGLPILQSQCCRKALSRR